LLKLELSNTKHNSVTVPVS